MNLLSAAKNRRTKRLRDVFVNDDGAIDLASIMVGIIVIGIIGGVVAATLFAVIPWAQDNGAKQQLDSVVTAESAFSGINNGQFTANLGTFFNATAANVAVFSDESKGYAAFKTSASGHTYYVTSNSSKATEVPAAWPATAPANYPANVTWPQQVVKSAQLVDDPSYEKGNDGVDGQGWDNYYGPTVTDETTVVHSGNVARQIDTTYPYDGVIVWQSHQVQSGTYQAGTWFKAPAGTVWNASMRTNGPYGEGYGSHLISATGDWQYASVNAPVTSGPYQAVGIQLRGEGIPVGITAYFDDASIYYEG